MTKRPSTAGMVTRTIVTGYNYIVFNAETNQADGTITSDVKLKSLKAQNEAIEKAGFIGNLKLIDSGNHETELRGMTVEEFDKHSIVIESKEEE